MPRPPRPRIPDIPLHVVHRGVDRAACFRDTCDFLRYLALLEEWASERRCAVHAFVLMTNHVHLLITPSEREACSRLMKDVAQRYSQYCNRTWKRSGPLWDGRFKSSLVDTDSYLLACQRYIEMNPVRARMVKNPGEYPWSSYRTNAYGVPSTLISPHRVYRAMARDSAGCRAAYRALFSEPQDPAQLSAIREALHGAFPLGSKAFIESVERMTGRRQGRRHSRLNFAGTAVVQEGV